MKLIISLALPLLVGFSSGFFTRQSISGWYAQLEKPWFNPPNYLFGPVWTLLYVLMGVSMYLVWKSEVAESVKRPALLLFGIQLFLNFWWSIIFFGWHQPGWALLEIAVLWVFILLTIVSFGKISSVAAWLLVPYISWVSFASVLNHAIWSLNK